MGEVRNMFSTKSLLPVIFEGDGVKETLESWGIVFHGVSTENRLMYDVTLPSGWYSGDPIIGVVDKYSRMPIYQLFDGGKKPRAGFYSVGLNIFCLKIYDRFKTLFDMPLFQTSMIGVTKVYKNGQEIYRTPDEDFDDVTPDYAMMKSNMLAKCWLDTNYPGWRS